MNQILLITSICVSSHILALLLGFWLGKGVAPINPKIQKKKPEIVRDIYKEEALNLD